MAAAIAGNVASSTAFTSETDPEISGRPYCSVSFSYRPEMAGPGMYVKHWSCDHVAYALCINCRSGSGLLAAAMGAAVGQGMGAAVRAAVEAAVEAVAAVQELGTGKAVLAIAAIAG
jgi:hypothetical protein